MVSDAIRAARTLLGDDVEVKRLEGGLNNNVYRCIQNRESFILKHFPSESPERSRRIQAEVSFLKHSNLCAPDQVPMLLGTDLYLGLVITEDIKGEVISSSRQVSSQHIEQALQLWKNVNFDWDHEQIPQLNIAIEGFEDPKRHLEAIEKRISRMRADILKDEEHRKYAQSLIIECKRRLADLENSISNKMDSMIIKKIEQSQMCISPGDFGFHNAILRNNKAVFFDFEFSGHDDPAKTVLDFIYQPRVPVLIDKHQVIEMAGYKHQDWLNDRCNQLEPVICLKWVCILLGCLDIKRAGRMKRLDNWVQSKEMIHSRLDKAQSYLGLL